VVEPDLPHRLGYAAVCETCGREVADGAGCTAGCTGLVTFRYATPVALRRPAASLWDYRDQLPVRDARNVVTLGEGGTPLLAARVSARLHWKAELANPTGSQKDRAISVAISKARELGAARVLITSTGSAGIACAAYCARAGLACVVVVARDVPPSRMAAMLRSGARVLSLEGSFAEAGRVLDRIASGGRWFRAGTNRRVNRYQVEGTKTIAYEILAQHGRVPATIVCGVGGGGTLAGIWRGFVDLARAGRCSTLPRMVAVHPAHVPRLALAFAAGARADADVEGLAAPETATCMDNLRAGRKSDLVDALAAIRDSGGTLMSVGEDEARLAQRRMAREEGLHPDLSASAAVAAAYRLAEGGDATSDCIVAVVSGAGYRDDGNHATSGPVGLTVCTDARVLEAKLEEWASV
jgi:threonine synthase